MKQVKIQSTTTIHVSKNLDYKDFTATNPDPQNKLKIVADWTRNVVCIKAGVDYYPAEIAEWDAVKALEKANVLTIGEVTEKKTKKKVEKMATRFSVWIDTPISGTNVQSFTAFSNDEQRKAGFTANTPASSIRVNTALREATLFATGFMKAFFDNSTLDATSTVAQMAAALSGLIMTKSQVQTYVTEQINTSVPEQVETLFNDKIIITNVPISEGDELTSGTIYLYYGG